MGKRIITQRRGRGTFTYKSHSHRYKGKIKNRVYDDMEKNNVVKGKIIDIIHCPGHSAPLARVRYEDNEEILMPAPLGIKVNCEISNGAKAEIKVGNILALKDIPEGTSIYNVESNPGKVAYCRSSGSFAKIVSKIDDKVIVRFPSKKQKELNNMCRAVIGIVAGSGRKEKPIVKAGKNWHIMHARGKLYPRTSGVAMNAVDHPFGSGRGRHVGKSKIPPRNAPPGRNIGLIRARRTGKRK